MKFSEKKTVGNIATGNIATGSFCRKINVFFLQCTWKHSVHCRISNRKSRIQTHVLMNFLNGLWRAQGMHPFRIRFIFNTCPSVPKTAKSFKSE